METAAPVGCLEPLHFGRRDAGDPTPNAMHVTCYKPAPTPIGCVSQNRMRPYFFDGPMYPHRGACRGLAAVDVTENRDEMLTFGMLCRFRVGSRQDCWPTIPRKH